MACINDASVCWEVLVLLIRDVGLSYDGHGGPPVTGLSFLLHGGLIVAVGAADELAARAETGAARVLDARDLSAIPGIVDAHLHLALPTGPDALSRVSRVSPQRLAAQSLLNAQRCLASGVTTVCDCGAPGRTGLVLAELSRGGERTLPRIQSCGPCLTTTGGHGEAIGMVADSAVDLRRRVRQLSREGADFIKVMATGGSLDPQTNRGRAQYSVAELTLAVEDAHRLGRRVVCHANGTEGIANSVRAGADVVAHCNWLAVDGRTLGWDQAVADELVARGTAIDLNVNGALARLADAGGGERSRWEVLQPLARRGVPVYLTSDGFGPDASSFPARLAAAGSALSIPARELVQRVTTLPSAATGLTDSAGGLRAGSRADIVLLDGDPEKDPTALSRPRFVVAGGTVVAENGSLNVTGGSDE